ncbi:glutathione S-transferase N-terminal domain-containing protein [Limnobacter humi]|uniref:Glutathione S-transferase N-terminal domain-containing protein n=1 Tax=Limnobacter humi TaxID=1778671 RepID=A0ABT1WCC3_9BURK|nr:glutathione S-transferase C-terminal domain-containing protein [Limnobacter humi]MCQ8895168.1 glutathione S-transferase N-terminal domain-containing protein [Limnobacter humi]
MKLVGSLTSPFVRKIRVQLLEKEIPFEFVLEDVWSPDTKITEHNPLGKVPALILNGGQVLFDSTVISGQVEYLMPTIPLLPTKPEMRAKVRTLEVCGQGISEAAVAILLEKRFHPAEHVSTAWVDRQTQKIHNGLAYFAHHVEHMPGHYLTDQFSIADIAAGCALFYLDFRMPELDWRKQYPALVDYAERMACRPSFEATRPVV